MGDSLIEEPSLSTWQHRIPHTSRSGTHDLPVDPKCQWLGRIEAPAVAPEHLEGGDVDDAAVGIRGGDDAPPDVTLEVDHRVADPHRASHPLILGVGTHPVDLDQHPEA